MKDLMRQIFKGCCRQLLVDHPLFESALDKVIEIEHENKLRLELAKRCSISSQGADAHEADFSRQTIWSNDAGNVQIEVKSYH